ncbi:hypothetical protein BDN67DRAFT_975078 [Paxillus ammoniavirescens]|nr:hypothetical protein BDN67DRAFT_975078 [Paxillus ammoniavirescens]
MALALPLVAPSDRQSPASEDGSVPPQTPISPTNAQTLAPSQGAELQNAVNPQSSTVPPNAAVTQVKRKPSRRANTAERRATHNAVERQRRETLNGRFLDLAALLPNLSQIRRPSKSAIVNSSIAHIHSSRRHRLLASRELRLLKLETDALLRELNEWRDRAGLPRVDEPVRGEGFAMVLSGEVEVLAANVGEEDEEGQGQYDGFEEGDEDYLGPLPTPMDETEDLMPANPPAVLKSANVFGHNVTGSTATPSDINIARLMPHAQPNSHGGPMIAQIPPSVSFENPAMPSLYEPQVTSHFPSAPYVGQHHAMASETDKVAAWTANMYSAYNSQQLQLQAQQSMFTPPNSAHRIALSTSPVSGGGYADHALLANLKRQQQLLALQHQHGAMAYGVDGDDASSVGSSHSGRERSGSFSAGSGYGSPPHGASAGNYEMPNASDFRVAKRMSATGLHVNTGVSGSWTGRGDEGMNGMMMKQAMSAPINVGGANGGGYGMMM